MPEIEAISLHHLHPGTHEVAHKPSCPIALGIHLGARPQLGVGAEHQIHPAAAPAQLTAAAASALEQLTGVIVQGVNELRQTVKAQEEELKALRTSVARLTEREESQEARLARLEKSLVSWKRELSRADR